MQKKETEQVCGGIINNTLGRFASKHSEILRLVVLGENYEFLLNNYTIRNSTD